MKDKVRFINDSSSTSSTPSTSTAPSTASSAAPSVKRVFKLDADDAHGVPLTTVYELASESSEVQSVAEVDWWCRVVHYDLQGDEGEQEAIDWSLDGYECYDLTMSNAYDADCDWVASAQVRGVQHHSSTQEQPWIEPLIDGSYHQVVLDSGADLSGTANTSGQAVRMLDAQGGLMANFGSRSITLDVGQAYVEEVFHASDVDVPLLSLGRLLKKGWSLAHRSNMLHLCHDGEGVEIPVSFNRNSLVVDAQVYAVRDQGIQEIETKVQALDQPRITVQTAYDIHSQGPEWNFLDGCGDPCLLTRGKARHDPSDVLGVHLWQFRTTLAFRDGEWELIEYEEPVIGLMNLAEPIVPAGDEDIPIFTVMHREKGYDPDRYGMEFVASMPKQGADSAGSSDPVAAAFFGSDPGGDDEVLDQPADFGGGSCQAWRCMMYQWLIRFLLQRLFCWQGTLKNMSMSRV